MFLKGLASMPPCQPPAPRPDPQPDSAALLGSGGSRSAPPASMAFAASQVAVGMCCWMGSVWRQSLSRLCGRHSSFHAAYGTNGLKLTRISSPPPRLNLYERPNKTIRTSAQLGISERAP
jgi:hypothetical protein